MLGRRVFVKGLMLPVALLAACFALEAREAARPQASHAEPAAWKPIQPGVEYRRFGLVEVRAASSPVPGPDCGDGELHVVRVDLRVAELVAVSAKLLDGKRRTAGEWCEEANLVVAINMGMFQTDGLSNVGYARIEDRTNSAGWR